MCSIACRRHRSEATRGLTSQCRSSSPREDTTRGKGGFQTKGKCRDDYIEMIVEKTEEGLAKVEGHKLG